MRWLTVDQWPALLALRTAPYATVPALVVRPRRTSNQREHLRALRSVRWLGLLALRPAPRAGERGAAMWPSPFISAKLGAEPRDASAQRSAEAARADKGSRALRATKASRAAESATV